MGDNIIRRYKLVPIFSPTYMGTVERLPCVNMEISTGSEAEWVVITPQEQVKEVTETKKEGENTGDKWTGRVWNKYLGETQPVDNGIEVVMEAEEIWDGKLWCKYV